MSISRNVRMNCVRELAERKPQTHALREEVGLRVIEDRILELQAEHREVWVSEERSASDGVQVRTALKTLERVHRTTIHKTLCIDCLEAFKREKFYTFDEDGFAYTADGLGKRREALAS